MAREDISPLSNFSKISNPDVSRGLLRSQILHGEFEVLVRLAEPESKPTYMKVLGLYSPGLHKVRIPCKSVDKALADTNVLSIELREHLSSSDDHS